MFPWGEPCRLSTHVAHKAYDLSLNLNLNLNLSLTRYLRAPCLRT